jgi:hypothetical protein
LAIAASVLVTLQPAPARTQQEETPAKASIGGAVVRIGTGEPIAARVILSRAATTGDGQLAPSPAGPAPLPPIAPDASGGATVASPPSPIPAVNTDGQGKFIIKDLEPGTYRLTVAANGYAREEYGQRVAGGQGTPISVKASQIIKDIVVRMTPAGYVTGRIADETGRPAVGAQVQLLRTSYNATGQRTYQSAGQTRVNDRGEYRLFWVTPGRYFLFWITAGARQALGVRRRGRQSERCAGELCNDVLPRRHRCE